jgi:hypothetical protein
MENGEIAFTLVAGSVSLVLINSKSGTGIFLDSEMT